MTERQIRPDPVRWFGYCYGMTLAPRYREWVLHDHTARTRWLRQVLRTTATLTPFILAVLIGLGGNWIAWVASLGGLMLAAIFSISYIDQYSEHTLTKHGYPVGTLRSALDEANADTNAVKRERYNAVYRDAD